MKTLFIFLILSWGFLSHPEAGATSFTGDELKIFSEAFTHETPVQNDTSSWNDIQWSTIEDALLAGSLSSKKIFIYVHAVWCPYCRRMNNEVLSDPEVQKLLERYFHPIRIDAESQETLRYFDNEMTEQQFARALQNESFPTFYFMNQNGEVFGNQPGLLPKELFMKLIYFVGTDAYLKGSFQEYEYPDSSTP